MTTMQQPLKVAFKDKRYNTMDKLLAYVEEISERIRVLPKMPRKPRKLMKELMMVTPGKQVYNTVELAREILKKRGELQPSEEKVHRHAQRVKRSLNLLIAQRQIPQVEIISPVKIISPPPRAVINHLSDIAKIAPQSRTRNGQYDVQKIYRELLKRPIPPGAPLISTKIIKNALKYLRKEGTIPPSMKKRKPRVREATNEDIERITPRVRQIVKYRRIQRVWRRLIDEEDAHAIAIEAAREAIEKSPEITGRGFDSYLGDVIRNRLIDAIRKQYGRTGKKALLEIEQKKVENLAAPDESYVDGEKSKKAQLNEILQKLHALHRRGQLPAKHLALWALYHHTSHDQDRIGNFYGVTGSRVCQILAETRKKLRKALEAETSK